MTNFAENPFAKDPINTEPLDKLQATIKDTLKTARKQDTENNSYDARMVNEKSIEIGNKKMEETARELKQEENFFGSDKKEEAQKEFLQRKPHWEEDEAALKKAA